MENIFRVGNEGLIDEFYFVGMSQGKGYAIFSNISGHQPVLVCLKAGVVPSPWHGWFKNRKDATAHALSCAENLIELIKAKVH